MTNKNNCYLPAGPINSNEPARFAYSHDGRFSHKNLSRELAPFSESFQGSKNRRLIVQKAGSVFRINQRRFLNGRSHCRKNCDIQDPEKTSLVDSALFPKIQPSTLLDNEKANFTANGSANNPHLEAGQNSPRASTTRQVVAALVAQLGTINTGMTFGFSAIALPQLQEADSIIPIKEGSTEESWIGTYRKHASSVNLDSRNIPNFSFSLCLFCPKERK